MLCNSCRLFFSLAWRSVISCRASSMLVTWDCREVMLELWDWNTCRCRCMTLLAWDVYLSNCSGISTAIDWTDRRSLLIVWSVKIKYRWFYATLNAMIDYMYNICNVWNPVSWLHTNEYCQFHFDLWGYHTVFLFFYFNYLMTLYMYYKIIIYTTVKNYGQIEYVYNPQSTPIGLWVVGSRELCRPQTLIGIWDNKFIPSQKSGKNRHA